jgi:CheY-like chemotaxis protein
LLERLGHTAELADNGVQALEAISRRRFDLVLLDCQMPEMDGYEAARRWREREPDRATPLIAMTANAMPEDRQRCLDAGMDDYLTKPLTREALARMIENWTDSRGAPA